jgi:competence protein ComEA
MDGWNEHEPMEMRKRMNRRFFKLIPTLALVLACASGAFAQEDETPAPKKPVSKALQESRAKAREMRQATKAKADADAKAAALDINRATVDELKKLPGITDAYAAAIIAKRPYKSKADLVTKDALPMGVYQTISKKVAVK